MTESFPLPVDSAAPIFPTGLAPETTAEKKASSLYAGAHTDESWRLPPLTTSKQLPAIVLSRAAIIARAVVQRSRPPAAHIATPRRSVHKPGAECRALSQTD